MKLYLLLIIICSIILISIFNEVKNNSFEDDENELEIETNAYGAELTSVKYKGVERLHDAQTFWNQHSPILFPIVGKLRYDVTLINGKEYAIPKHGFAMNMEFVKIGEHSYKLFSNEETLKQFPFDFRLYVNYYTKKNELFFNYKVINKTPDKNMLFGIGGHPGFKCDYWQESYTVEFEEEENDIKIIPVDISVGLMSDKLIDGNTVIKNKKILKIKKESFVNDAIVFTNMKSKSVFLKKNGEKILKFNFEHFKYLGIWSQEGNAPFVCFEPWYNTPDYVNSTIEFKDKKDIIELKPEEEFTISFSVQFY